VELSELLERLVELARELGLEVRELRAGALSDPPPASGVCRLRGATWVMLCDSDTLAQRVDTLVGALRAHAAPGTLEGRYLPPALRERLAKELG
jgi:hypothetical protein